MGTLVGAGMVDESLAKLYESRGLRMISLREGRAAFVDEWAMPQRLTGGSVMDSEVTLGLAFPASITPQRKLSPARRKSR